MHQIRKTPIAGFKGAASLQGRGRGSDGERDGRGMGKEGKRKEGGKGEKGRDGGGKEER